MLVIWHCMVIDRGLWQFKYRENSKGQTFTGENFKKLTKHWTWRLWTSRTLWNRRWKCIDKCREYFSCFCFRVSHVSASFQLLVIFQRVHLIFCSCRFASSPVCILTHHISFSIQIYVHARRSYSFFIFDSIFFSPLFETNASLYWKKTAFFSHYLCVYCFYLLYLIFCLFIRFYSTYHFWS